MSYNIFEEDVFKKKPPLPPARNQVPRKAAPQKGVLGQAITTQTPPQNNKEVYSGKPPQDKKAASSGMNAGDIAQGFLKVAQLAASMPRPSIPGLPGGGMARPGGVQAVNPGQLLSQQPRATPTLGAFIKGGL